jgi:fructose-bisphosphate aldolase class II
MIAARSVCKNRFEAFGSAGQAAKIKVISLEKMASRYAAGEMAAIVR